MNIDPATGGVCDACAECTQVLLRPTEGMPLPLFVGFGVSGAVFQSLTANPLGSDLFDMVPPVSVLSGRELTRVAGTFGDPFRVINLLPGVTTTMSLLPMPIVRWRGSAVKG